MPRALVDATRCASCNAPKDCSNPFCEEIDHASMYCHVCQVLWRTVVSNPYWTALSDKWKADRIERRKNMGL